MVNAIYPLDKYKKCKKFLIRDEVGVVMAETTTFSLFQFAFWPSTRDHLTQTLKSTYRLEMVPKIGGLFQEKKYVLIAIDPLKFWLVFFQADISLPEMNPDIAVHLDLSHSKSLIRISGPHGERLLNQFLPVDLRETNFSQDKVVSSAIHHVGVHLWRKRDSFNILIPRSFVASIWQLLEESAMQYGLKVI